jgi:hypothetical protein
MLELGFRAMNFRKVVVAALVSASSLAALAPGDRVPADIAVYVEGAPVSEGLTAMRTVVSSVAGEGVWSIMAANLEQRSGINLLEAAKLEEIGVNTKTSWGLAVNMEIEAAGNPFKPEFVMIIPTQSNPKFYDFLKSKITESQMPINKELEPGRLFYFGSENDPGYLLKSDDAVLVSNKLELVKSMVERNSKPVSGAQFYTTMRSQLWSRNQNKQPLAAFYLNPKLIISSLKIQSEMIRQLQKDLNEGAEKAPVLDDNSPYIAEIRDNLQSAGGALVANAERVSAYFSYKYKEGYLSDTSKIYPRIIQVKTSPLTSDSLAKNPVHYSLLKLNVGGVIDLFRSLSPVFDKKYGKAMADFKTEFNIDIEKQILATLRGNFNFQVLSVPTENKLKDLLSWELYGAYGIKKGSAENWLQLFKTGEKIAKKSEANKAQKTKFEFEDGDEGKFVIIKGEEKIAGKKKPVTGVFLIREDEIIVSNSKINAIKATKGGETALSDRLAKISYDAAQGIFFVDLQQIFKAVTKMKEGSSLKNYASMLEKLKFFSIVSSIQGDFATAESTLQLRK